MKGTTLGKHATFLAASHIILRNYAGEILFQRRSRTKLYNGWLGLPAGHVDEGEHPHEAAMREAKEELGVTVKIDDIIAECHATRRYPDKRVYFDAYYDFGTAYSGQLTIREPEKCLELVWVDPANLPEDIIEYERKALEVMDTGSVYFYQDLDSCEDIPVPTTIL